MLERREMVRLGKKFEIIKNQYNNATLQSNRLRKVVALIVNCSTVAGGNDNMDGITVAV